MVTLYKEMVWIITPMKITKDSVLCKIQRVNNDRKNTSDNRIITDYNEMYNELEMLDKVESLCLEIDMDLEKSLQELKYLEAQFPEEQKDIISSMHYMLSQSIIFSVRLQMCL